MQFEIQFFPIVYQTHLMEWYPLYRDLRPMWMGFLLIPFWKNAMFCALVAANSCYYLHPTPFAKDLQRLKV